MGPANVDAVSNGSAPAAVLAPGADSDSEAVEGQFLLILGYPWAEVVGRFKK